jgi:hypothetical protein
MVSPARIKKQVFFQWTILAIKNCVMTTSRKLKIKEDTIIFTINVPADYKKSLGSLPAGTKLTSSAKTFHQVHWFVKDKAQMESELKTILPLIKENIICWIFYPKGRSKTQGDLTRDKGWEELMKYDMQWISLISFDDIWSAFGMRQKTEADKKKETIPKDRPVFHYVDPKTKTVKLPGDFAAALKKNKGQEAFFNTLSFTNKKEYIEWIVSAKREETRNERVKGSIERLGKQWKNPANR